ncbi:MAG: hypothetical protein ABIJ12_13035 [bacterium]
MFKINTEGNIVSVIKAKNILNPDSLKGMRLEQFMENLEEADKAIFHMDLTMESGLQTNFSVKCIPPLATTSRSNIRNFIIIKHSPKEIIIYSHIPCHNK